MLRGIVYRWDDRGELIRTAAVGSRGHVEERPRFVGGDRLRGAAVSGWFAEGGRFIGRASVAYGAVFNILIAHW